MKTSFFFIGLIWVLIGCGETENDSQETSHTETNNQTEFSSRVDISSTELQQQIKLHGIEILNAYYCLSSDEFREDIDKEMGFSMRNDLQYTIRYKPEELKLNFILNELDAEFIRLSKEERATFSKKAILFLNISKMVSGEFCGVDGEYYWEVIYEIPELQGFIDQYIDPKLGQSVHSLASGEAAEIQVEIWNYLVEVDRQDRLRIIGQLVGKCSELEL